jgi:EmrB/QacA subfamily drug resistance transporter
LTQSTLSAADRRLTLTALAVVVLLSALDQTIVATAMPRIIEELRGLSMYAWATTAYMLTSTVTVPIYGKLADQYGRKPMLAIGVVIFLLGSALCGLAGEFGDLPLLGGGMMQLVVFRAVQGVGAGALMTVSFAVMADMYPPRERGRLFGVFGAVFGLATVIGPLIGGVLTDHGALQVLGYEVAGWRWVFYVNLPLGLLALFLVINRMPGTWGPPSLPEGQQTRNVPVAVDYLGAGLVVVAAGALLLALTFGGTTWPWVSPQILALLGGAVIAFMILLAVEARAKEPILPLHLFGIRAFRITALASFVMSMAFLGVVMFMPLYLQVVRGVSATHSGLALLPLMGAMIVSSVASGRIVARVGRYKPFMIAGGIVLLAGVASLTGIGPDTSERDLAWRLALTGLGLGPAQTFFSLVMQNAAPPRDVGAATGMAQFSRQMGAAVGVALFGTFLIHGLTTELPKHVPLLPGGARPQLDLAHAQSQAMRPTEIRQRVERALDERYALIARAYEGDAVAAEEILSDPRIPEAIKAALRDGGVRARVHRSLLERASLFEHQLRSGPQGRDQLMHDAQLPATLRSQLANIPERAFADPQVIAGVARLFREALLAKEDEIAAATVRRSLESVRAAMSFYTVQLVERIQRGMKVAFAAAIAHMLERALWIVLAALLVVLFIPELPLRSRATAPD